MDRATPRQLLLALSVASAGCSEPPAAERVSRTVSAAMPRLVPVGLGVPDSALPELRYSRLAVSTSGALAYTGAFDGAIDLRLFRIEDETP